jgi:hypothetical protein
MSVSSRFWFNFWMLLVIFTRWGEDHQHHPEVEPEPKSRRRSHLLQRLTGREPLLHVQRRRKGRAVQPCRVQSPCPDLHGIPVRQPDAPHLSGPRTITSIGPKVIQYAIEGLPNTGRTEWPGKGLYRIAGNKIT